MRKLLPLLLLLVSASAPAPARDQPAEKIVVIINVTLVDVETGTLVPRQAVVIKKGRITGIAKRAIIQESPLILIVNAEGKYLIPGLWDMRVHLLEGRDAEHVKTQVLPLLVANGVTGVRDLGGDVEALKRLRSEIESGAVVGPRLVLSRATREKTQAAADPALAVRNLEEAQAAVAAFRPPRPGVGLLAATDSPPGREPGRALHRELALLVEAGLKPLEALQAATLNPARFLGKEKEMGTVDKGKLADLVLLDGDPVEDIRNLDKIAGVVVAGRYYSRRELDAMLAQAEAAKGSGK